MYTLEEFAFCYLGVESSLSIKSISSNLLLKVRIYMGIFCLIYPLVKVRQQHLLAQLCCDLCIPLGLQFCRYWYLLKLLPSPPSVHCCCLIDYRLHAHMAVVPVLLAVVFVGTIYQVGILMHSAAVFSCVAVMLALWLLGTRQFRWGMQVMFVVITRGRQSAHTYWGCTSCLWYSHIFTAVAVTRGLGPFVMLTYTLS